MNNFDIKKMIADAPYGTLTATETNLLKEYSFFGNIHGKNIRPSIDTVMRQTKLSRSTVIRGSKSLVAKGFLIETYRPKRGSWSSIQYELNIPLLEKIRITYASNYSDYMDVNQCQYDTGCKNRSVMVPASSVIEKNIQCHGDTLITNISTNELPINKVELASNSTAVPEQPPVISEAEPTNPIPEPEPKEHTEPLAAEPVSQPKAKRNENYWKPTVLKIFAYWQTVLKHSKAKLDANRTRCIVNALKLGFTEEELKKAIDGLSKSPYHMGNNDRNTVYDDIDLIFRNAKYIEKFMSYSDNPPTPRIVFENKKPSYSDKVEAANKAMGSILAKSYPEMLKFFPELMPEPKLADFNVPRLRQETVINERWWENAI